MVLLLLALACAPEPWQPQEPELDEAAVSQVLDLTDPDFALALLSELPARLTEEGCEPMGFADGQGLRETWSACPDGLHQGNLERFDDRTMAWLEADGLQLVGRDGEPQVQLDGAVEYVLEEDELGQARLARLDLAASICTEALCEQDADAPSERWYLDLGWTLVPEPGELSDVLLSGTLMSPALGPTLVEGSWTHDAAVCELEPISGVVLLRAGQTHALHFDGERACDGCAAWILDGEDQGTICRD